MHELITIRTPDDWSAAKDIQHFEERWSPEKDYSVEIFDWLGFHYQSLVETMDSALEHFYRRNARIVVIAPECQSLEEKIERLLTIAKALNPGKHRDRLLEDLEACRWVENERKRVLAEYQAAGENGWLFPIIELVDYIGWAAAILNDTVRCEHEPMEGGS